MPLRQASSAGMEQLLGISKQVDGYLWSLLTHGVSAWITHIWYRVKASQPGGNPWVEQLRQR